MAEDPVYTRNLPELFAQMRLAITVSAEMRERVIGLGCPPHKVATHYTGVPADYFSERSRPARRVILQVGRFVSFKGHDTTLCAVALARRQLPDLKLRLVGDGPLRPTLEKVITNLGLSDSVEIVGWLQPKQVAAELSDAFALVHPSRTGSGDVEGLPNAVVEALAAGLPVVATHHAGVPEAVRYSEPGWLLKEADAEGMADRIVRLASDTGLWDRLSREGSALARNRFHLSSQNQRLRELYERVRIR
jgi:colanic acid/amylovoran biosynthesis glycosyltransferase